MIRRCSWLSVFLRASPALVLALGCSTNDVGETAPEGTGGMKTSGDGDGDGMGGEIDGVGGAMDEPDQPPPVPECPESTQGYATEVISHEFGDGQDFGQDDFPDPILGGPQGKGCCAGSLDVVSLGDGGRVVLGFGDRTIVDGEGPDFIVFENAFWPGGDESAPVVELGQVSVSIDGETWVDFLCEPGESPPYGDCAGWRPVHANVLDPGTDPFDPEVSGGAPYDLSDVGLSEASFVRVTDVAGDEVVFDLDAVSVVNGRCE